MKVAALKQQYETLIQQVKNEQRDLEVKRKKEAMELQKLKDEEMLKIKKEKKVLEQRAKNINYSNQNKQTSSSTLETTILRKKLSDATDQIKQLNQRIEEISNENFDLRQEL
jgi:mannitol-specific phosphotransferase system IIBC component